MSEIRWGGEEKRKPDNAPLSIEARFASKLKKLLGKGNKEIHPPEQTLLPEKKPASEREIKTKAYREACELILRNAGMTGTEEDAPSLSTDQREYLLLCFMGNLKTQLINEKRQGKKYFDGPNIFSISKTLKKDLEKLDIKGSYSLDADTRYDPYGFSELPEGNIIKTAAWTLSNKIVSGLAENRTVEIFANTIESFINAKDSDTSVEDQKAVSLAILENLLQSVKPGMENANYIFKKELGRQAA